MFRLFGQLGRSRDLRYLDQELRAVGVHPALVPEAVKLTAIRLLKQEGRSITLESCAEAAAVLGYCMQGATGFVEENGLDFTREVEQRLADAVEAGDSLDAQLVLLALHAGLVQPGVEERYGFEVD
ncbi:MAG: hypothetical protein CMM50_13105 [Rhodospirillaceae bacterium]|nr:hypothetical protein [Rhodospirillaceae bacterium]